MSKIVAEKIGGNLLPQNKKEDKTKKSIINKIESNLLSNIKTNFTDDELKKVREIFLQKMNENKEILDNFFERNGYKNNYLQDYYRNGFINRLLYNYQEPISEFTIFTEHILTNARDFINLNKNNKTNLFKVIKLIFIRCNLIVKEIECLIKNGFASGAVARWRSLYEYSVISIFIINSGEETAKRYLDFIDIERYKEANDYNRYCEYLCFSKLENNIVDDLKSKYNELKKKYGDEFANGDYGWASNIIKKENKRDRIKFDEIRDQTDQKDLLIYYKFSCQYIHSSSKNLIFNLANIYGTEINIDDYKALGDASNIGFSEPIQLTMYSFFNAFASLISINVKEGDLVNILFLREKIKEITNKFIDIENKIEKEERGKTCNTQ